MLAGLYRNSTLEELDEMRLQQRLHLVFYLGVIAVAARAQSGYIELNPANTIAPNSGTYYVGCFNQYGQLLPSCCPSIYHGLYTNSGGHNHSPGPRSTLTQHTACYSNYTGVPLTIATSTAGQAELIRMCGPLCSDWLLFSVYKQGNFQYLQSLGAGSNYDLIGATPYHASNHFGTPYVNSAMEAIANEYAASPNGHRIDINDISLVYGGVFDIAGTWSETNHQTHRMGLNVDVRYNGAGNSVQDFETFSNIAANYSGTVQVHSAGTPNQHIHINFLNIY